MLAIRILACSAIEADVGEGVGFADCVGRGVGVGLTDWVGAGLLVTSGDGTGAAVGITEGLGIGSMLGVGAVTGDCVGAGFGVLGFIVLSGSGVDSEVGFGSGLGFGVEFPSGASPPHDTKSAMEERINTFCNFFKSMAWFNPNENSDLNRLHFQKLIRAAS